MRNGLQQLSFSLLNPYATVCFSEKFQRKMIGISLSIDIFNETL